MKIKKIISLVLCIIVCTIFSVPSFALTEEEKNDNYNILLEKGLSENFLSNVTDEYLQRMTEIIGDNELGCVETSVGNLSDYGLSTFGTISNNSLTVQLEVVEICKKNSNEIDSVLVGASWEWAKNKPFYTGKDAISLNWNSSVVTYAGGFYAQDLYKDNAANDWEIFNEYTNPAEAEQGGIGHWTDLKSFKSYVGGSMLFVLKPVSTIFNGTDNLVTINAVYAHSKSPISGLSIEIVGVGIGITANSLCDTTSVTCEMRYSL